MKLIQILARDLKVWPAGARFIINDGDQGVYADMGQGYQNVIVDASELNDRKGVTVDEQEWLAAVDVLSPNAPIQPWSGEGLPPIGTDCIVTPHNTQWGFNHVEDHNCRVLGYHHEAVWLAELLSDGTASMSFITTRTDKVDFNLLKTPEQIARDKAIEEMILIDEKGSLSRTHFCGLLYDAGYLKQVAP